LRERYSDITDLGADVVAIGTGNERYAAAFIKDTEIPFRVLVDDDAIAANAAAIPTATWFQLLHPSRWRVSRETSKRGYHTHKAGKRVKQLGATFVIGPGDRVRYEHIDADSTDHASIDDVVAALRDT
jgi:peroxiredoxin